MGRVPKVREKTDYLSCRSVFHTSPRTAPDTSESTLTLCRIVRWANGFDEIATVALAKEKRAIFVPRYQCARSVGEILCVGERFASREAMVWEQRQASFGGMVIHSDL